MQSRRTEPKPGPRRGGVTRRGRRACAAWAVVIAWLFLSPLAATPAAANEWLVLLVDRSNSVDDGELALQRQAYLNVLNDPEVIEFLGETLVAIVEFDSDTYVMSDFRPPMDAAARYARHMYNVPRSQTGIGNALTRALQLLAGKPGRAVIDISGDGRENISQRQLTTARRRVLRGGIIINGLVLENPQDPDLEEYFREQIATGFVITTPNFAGFEQALREKLMREMTLSRLLPEPAREQLQARR